MNNRIQQLKSQAQAHADAETGNWLNNYTEKFLELVVQDSTSIICALMFKEDKKLNHNSQVSMAYYDSQLRLKLHFQHSDTVTPAQELTLKLIEQHDQAITWHKLTYEPLKVILE